MEDISNPFQKRGADDSSQGNGYISACRKAAELIRASRFCVALTGAGISTESGIPDFRSPGAGLWSRIDPMDLLSATAFELRPARFYEFIHDLVDTFSRAEPNAAHIALARLEQEGYVKAIITQNIDGLHQKAGARNVLEVHGNARSCTCISCGRGYSMEETLRAVSAGEVPPRCASCNSPLKPDIVLFEDPMPEDFALAQQAALQSDLMIVIGSSLEVAPACYLPSMAGRLIIINLQPTPCDSQADVVIRNKAAETMQIIVRFILEESEGKQ
ncbi:MAG: NAD-dependent deacylase [Firmicutes bacterium]|nr:NAD-dependent deacylase [Bacillota bacterium]